MTRATSRSPELVAQGFYAHREASRQRLRANLYMDGPLFERIRSLAIEEQSSLSTTIRALICDGLAARDVRSAA